MGENCGRCPGAYGKMKQNIILTIRAYLMPKRSALFLCVFGGIVFTSIALAENPPSALNANPSSIPTQIQNQTKDPTRADEVKTTASEGKPVEPSSYIYDLQKLIVKSRVNIKRVNEKIKEEAVLKRNQQREERARQYYEKGIQLSEEGKLEQAREYFEKAIRITEHPEMAHYIKESVRRLKTQESALKKEEQQHLRELKEDEKNHLQETETAYQEAVSLYHQKKFRAAKDGFEHVDEMYPDYKATRSYLKIVDQDIITGEALGAKQQQKEMERQQQEAEIARQKEKKAWRSEIETKEKGRKGQLREQADVAYGEAMRLYKDKKYKKAKEKFQEVEWVMPDYKATDKYLKRIDKDIEREQKQIDQENARALERQRWQEVVTKGKMGEQKKKADRQQLEDQAKFLYQPAVALFNKKRMDEAWEKFNEIEKIIPNYKSTHSYMDRILKDHPEKAKQLKEQEIQETQLLTDLVTRSARLYGQISELANDKNTVVAKKKLAKVEEVLNNLKQEKERTLKQIHEGEERKQQKEQAKIKALEEQQRREKQAQRQQQLTDIAQKAADINDEILKLVQAKDYTRAKAKFDELERTMADLRSVKESTSQKGEKEEQPVKQQEKLEPATQGHALEVQQQKEQERQHREQLRQERLQAQQEKRTQEQKRREDLRQQKQQQRQKEMERRRQEAEQKEKARIEKQKEAQQAHWQAGKNYQEKKAITGQAQQEAKRKTELEKIFQERQQLGSEQQAVRQELVNGVEAIYQEAVNLYKSGNYQAALKRFSYVQNLIPNYKDTDIFLKKFQNFSTPPAAPHLEKATTAPSRAEEVSKTLDLFDPNTQ